jgi:hypothetical protein
LAGLAFHSKFKRYSAGGTEAKLIIHGLLRDYGDFDMVGPRDLPRNSGGQGDEASVTRGLGFLREHLVVVITTQSAVRLYKKVDAADELSYRPEF